MYKCNNIVLNNFDAKERVIKYDWDKFKEMEACTLNRFQIDDKIINKLNEMKKLKMLIINHCIFKNTKPIESPIESLILTYSKNFDFKIIKNTHKINRLLLTRLGNIDIRELKIFSNLKELLIFECYIKNFSEIEELKKLKELKLDGSQIDNKDKLEKIKNSIKLQYNTTYHVGN